VSSNPAFESVVADVYAPLQRYLRRRTDPATAEDVLSDVLLVIWRRVADIPPDAPVAWCYGVARGCLANTLRGYDRLSEARSMYDAVAGLTLSASSRF
jgi:RNA polymerase sigma-70 factor (ECF subfamily)